MTPSPHIPVMAQEVITALAPQENGIYVDGTFGRGGYTQRLLETQGTQVYAIDRDPDAIDFGQTLVNKFAPRLHLIQGRFGDMKNLLARENINQVDGITLDVGVSSPQIDDGTRGFSFSKPAPLDMRMERTGQSAADVIGTMDEKSLADMIFHLGGERHARRVAAHIVKARHINAITQTVQLADIIRAAVPRAKDGLDPATRTFQALRIYVNDELGELQKALRDAEGLLKPSGRLAVVSFHSLEDKIVKDFINQHGKDQLPSRHIPVTSHRPKSSLSIITRKPITPSPSEIRANPRASSAKLRVAERTENPVMSEALS